MNTNLKVFLAIFFFITGIIGIVLGVLNMMREPAATSQAVIFGAVGVCAMVGGWMTIKKRTY